MVDVGVDGKIGACKDGIGHSVTHGYPSRRMDKFTAWLDERKWCYEYLK